MGAPLRNHGGMVSGGCRVRVPTAPPSRSGGSHHSLHTDHGPPQACFVDNFIGGKRLQRIDSATLTALGCADFEDNKALAAAIRELFGSELPHFADSVADVQWSPLRVLEGAVAGYGQAV